MEGNWAYKQLLNFLYKNVDKLEAGLALIHFYTYSNDVVSTVILI
jgi:hypothetical protein